jgi:hypothetical protein
MDATNNALAHVALVGGDPQSGNAFEIEPRVARIVEKMVSQMGSQSVREGVTQDRASAARALPTVRVSTLIDFEVIRYSGIIRLGRLGATYAAAAINIFGVAKWTRRPFPGPTSVQALASNVITTTPAVGSFEEMAPTSSGSPSPIDSMAKI